MKELNLSEIKQIELQILKKFKSFCDENNISYFLSNGTLLGAVKYKGFIPWDDDIDVFVMRKDYNKLISLFEGDETYRLHSFERNQDYRFPFAKLCDMSTLKEETNVDNGTMLGLDIDIFPLDFWNNDLNEAKQEVKKIKKRIFLLELTKLIKSTSTNPIKRVFKGITMFFLKLRGSKHFIRQIIKESDKDHQRGSSYLGCKSWCIYGEREIIPAEVFSDTVEVEFEGEKFPAPIGYDTYLRSLYGDYENDPPLDKQSTHHYFRAYRL